MPTEVIKTIKPAGGGDYTSLNSWEVANRKDLVAADEVSVPECYSGGSCITPGSTFVMNSTSWTTDATRRIVVRAATGEEHVGVWDTGKAYIESTSTGGSALILRNSIDAFLEKMQFKATDATVVSECISSTNDLGAVTLDVDRCIVRYTTTAINSLGALHFKGASGTVKNSVIIENTGTGYSQGVLRCSSTGSITAYNTTVISQGTGVGQRAAIFCRDAGSTVTTQNCYIAFEGSAGGCYISVASGVINQGSTDATINTEATSVSLQNVPYSTATFQSVTAGAENLQHTDTSTLLNTGTDLTSSGVVFDILGAARPQSSSYDIGAFEILPNGPSAVDITTTTTLLRNIDTAQVELMQIDTAQVELRDIDTAWSLE